MNRTILPVVLSVLLAVSVGSAFAHPHFGQVLINGHTQEYQTETIPLDGTIALEKSTLLLHIPEGNPLPWAFVEGNVVDHVKGYPVIIQIAGDNTVHFAQTDVGKDGSYEYRFRVSAENGIISNVSGEDFVVVVVKIFKVVHLTDLEST